MWNDDAFTYPYQILETVKHPSISFVLANHTPQIQDNPKYEDWMYAARLIPLSARRTILPDPRGQEHFVYLRAQLEGHRQAENERGWVLQLAC